MYILSTEHSSVLLHQQLFCRAINKNQCLLQNLKLYSPSWSTSCGNHNFLEEFATEFLHKIVVNQTFISSPNWGTLLKNTIIKKTRTYWKHFCRKLAKTNQFQTRSQKTRQSTNFNRKMENRKSLQYEFFYFQKYLT